MEENIIKDKSFNFAVRIVNLYKFFCNEKKEFIMSKQLMRSGTSIGANVAEADRGVSRKDFINKMGIALKEANESDYWIELLYKTNYLEKTQYESLKRDIDEILRLAVAILKTANENQDIDSTPKIN